MLNKYMMMNTGGVTNPYSPSDFENETLNPGLSKGLFDLSEFYADPSNLPAWYGTEYNPDTGAYDKIEGMDPIAGFNQTQLDAQDQLADAAASQTQLGQLGTQTLAGQLDPTSEYNQQIAGAAATAAGSPFGGSGTFGGARHSRAANQAAANAILRNQNNALANLSNVQGAAAQGANTLGSIGQQHQDLAQQNLNQDIQAWNYMQNLPHQQLQNLLSLGQIAQAGQSNALSGQTQSGGFNLGNILKQGITSGLTGGLSSGIGSLLGGIFGNTGGMVRRRIL